MLVVTLQEGGTLEANDLLVPLAKCRHPGRASPMGEVVSMPGSHVCRPSLPMPSLQELVPRVPASCLSAHWFPAPWPCTRGLASAGLLPSCLPGSCVVRYRLHFPELGFQMLDTLCLNTSWFSASAQAPITDACVSLRLGANATYARSLLGFPHIPHWSSDHYFVVSVAH